MIPLNIWYWMLWLLEFWRRTGPWPILPEFLNVGVK